MGLHLLNRSLIRQITRVCEVPGPYNQMTFTAYVVKTVKHTRVIITMNWDVSVTKDGPQYIRICKKLRVTFDPTGIFLYYLLLFFCD